LTLIAIQYTLLLANLLDAASSEFDGGPGAREIVVRTFSHAASLFPDKPSRAYFDRVSL
jgi:hypothetical protein